MVPGRLVLVRPLWVLPALQGALLIALVVANPRRIDRQSKILRMLSLLLAALLSLANGWSVGLLVVDIVHGKLGGTAGPLLITGAAIWLTNVIAFALWYWEFDRGGPVARALGTQQYPDFQFPQMVSPPQMVAAGLGADFQRLPVPGVHQRLGLQPHRRHAPVTVGEDGDDRAIGHLDHHRGAGRVPRCQHPAVITDTCPLGVYTVDLSGQ